MALEKVTYVDGETVIGAKNLNDIQDEIIENAANIETKQDILVFDDSPEEGSNNPVKSGGVYSSIQNAEEKVKLRQKSVTLVSSSWVGNGFWTQSFPANGYSVTENTRVDLSCNRENMGKLLNSGTESVYVSNDGGVLVVYATGAKPSTDIVVLADFQEVIVI